MTKIVAASLAGAVSAQLVLPPFDFEAMDADVKASVREEVLEELSPRWTPWGQISDEPTAQREAPLNAQFFNSTLTVKSDGDLCDNTVKQHSGYFKLGDQNKEYFYWFFESRNDPANDPTVMWLTGGPGCSSMMALLTENGPCWVQSDGTTTHNEFSWNEKANVVWVDQPPGTGFSKGDYDHDEAGVGKDMYLFLQALFQEFPQYNKRFFVTGESYAGHYVPAVTHEIWKRNKNLESGFVTINMEGFAIGNGLTAPEIQYGYYADMAYQAKDGPYPATAPPAIGETAYKLMKVSSPVCIEQIKACQSGKVIACETAMVFCQYTQMVPYQMAGLNPYDMRIKCEKPPLCYDFSGAETFYNDPDNQKKLGADGKWESCNFVVNKMFTKDWMQQFEQFIPEMLNDGIRVLIYAGDVDFICNWMGNKAWATQLGTDGTDAWHIGKSSDNGWNVDGAEAGMLRQSSNFAFLQVYQAGHMVPMDQPKAALQMLNEFTEGKISPAAKKSWTQSLWV